VALVGLDGRAADGGTVDPDEVQRWLDEGIAPNGVAGRGFIKGSVHGFDLTFAAPKSVSLLRALTDDIGEKVMQAAHQRAITAAMTYLHQHLLLGWQARGQRPAFSGGVRVSAQNYRPRRTHRRLRPCAAWKLFGWAAHRTPAAPLPSDRWDCLARAAGADFRE
jgi:TrwC relaxase